MVSVEGCYGDIQPSDAGTGRCDGVAGCRRQFHAFAVHAGGCVQQDVEACIDGNGFRLWMKTFGFPVLILNSFAVLSRPLVEG